MISNENGVNVSARSDGSINVQLVLESVGGGGHFDSAGAYFAGATLEEAETTIIGAIDLYMNNLNSEDNND